MTNSEMRNPKSEITANSEIRNITSRAGFGFRYSDFREAAVVRHYVLFCLASLFLLVVCLAERGLGWWSLVPALIGCLTLLVHWSHGPPLVLASLAGLLGMTGARYRSSYAGWPHAQMPRLMDLLLCVAVLGYVIGHYRVASLLRPIFAADSRRPRVGGQRLSVAAVHPWEIAFMGFSVPLWVVGAVVMWAWMMEGKPPLDLPDEWWQMLRLLWVVLTVLAAAGTVAGYLRWTRATPAESLLYLQDQCWRHTRREQGRLNRWLTWAHSRAHRNKVTS